MDRIVLNNKGFSLIEMMIALIIISISFLALSAVMVSAINVNLENELRNTASRLTSQTAEVLMIVPYEEISSCGVTSDPEAHNYNSSYIYDNSNECLGTDKDSYKKYPDPHQTVSTMKKNFNIVWDAQLFNDTTKQIIITTTYVHNGINHSTQSVIYRSKA